MSPKHDVFLSHARSSSGPAARATHAALTARGVSTFLDSQAIEHTAQFPAELLAAILGARVIVVFVHPVYFTRWYCLWEWRVARSPFLAVSETPGASEGDKIAALAGLVLVLPAEGLPTELDRFPPHLRNTNWPRANESQAIADLVQRQLEVVNTSLSDRLEVSRPGSEHSIRAALGSVLQLPPPQSLANVPSVPVSLPASIGDQFVGRGDDLWRIDDLLATRTGGMPGTAALTGTLVGGGGVGKTRLALEYVHRFGPSRFRGGIFWISAGATQLELEEIHHSILSALNSASHGGPIPTLKEYRDGTTGCMLAQDLRAAFAALPEEMKSLVVVDDVPQPPAGQPPLPIETWCPMSGLAAVLLTSRLHRLGEVGSVTPIPIDVLSPEPAIQLLTHGVSDVAALNESAWAELAAWVGYLPLALILLNAAFTGGGLVPSALLERARRGSSTTEELDKAMDALRTSVPSGVLRGITEAFSAAYELLPPAVQRVARIFAQGAPTPLPEVLLRAIGTEIESEISPEARLVLVSRSLVTPWPSSSGMFAIMHGVLGDFLRAKCQSEPPVKELAQMAMALLFVWHVFPGTDPTNWPLLAAIAPHSAVVAERLGRQEKDALLLRTRLADWIGHTGGYAVARDMMRGLVIDSREVFGPENERTLTYMVHAVRWTGHAGDVSRARQVYEDLIPFLQEKLGADHRLTLTSRANLGRLVGEAKDYQHAKRVFETLVPDFERLLGRDDPETLTARINLAAAAGHCGDPRRARDEYAEVAAARTRLLGPDDIRTLLARKELAYWTAKTGDVQGGIQMLKELLHQMVSTIGADHPYTRTTISLLDDMSKHGRQP